MHKLMRIGDGMPARSTAKRATNVSLDPDLVAEAKNLGLNISKTCERGLVSGIKAARELAWLAENAAAIESSNAYVAAHGLPLASFRQF